MEERQELTREYWDNNYSLAKLREFYRDILGGKPSSMGKEQLIDAIIEAYKGGAQPVKDPRGRKTQGSKGNCKDENIDKASSDVSSTVKNKNVTAGILEIHSDGYGFLRGENYEGNVLTDIYVSKNTIRDMKLRKGDYIEGISEKGKENSLPFLKIILRINGKNAKSILNRPYFDDLTPYYPTERLHMEIEGEKCNYSMRLLDIIAPIGKGQRGLIVAPPKAGKTTLLKNIAHSIEVNHKEVNLIVLLVDERPEEVTDLRRFVKGEVVSSTFDEGPDHHIRAAELVLNRAKRLVEMGEDVVILLDSITKLARAYNAVVPASGKTLSGGIDPVALQAPKRFFGSARNIEDGGSLTILATALVDTGSKMDDVIYEEFKGTGNMEVQLSRMLSEKRIFPALDLYRSGTRKDELLLSKEEGDCAYYIRRYMDRADEAVSNLLDFISRTATNDEFVKKIPSWVKMLTE